MATPLHPRIGDTRKVDRPDKQAHPLFWMLVMAAILAFGWAIYNRSASGATPAMTRAGAALAAAVLEKPAPRSGAHA